MWVGITCAPGGWAAAGGCYQAIFLFGSWWSRAMVCHSPLPGVGKLAMVVVQVQGASSNLIVIEVSLVCTRSGFALLAIFVAWTQN